MTPSSWAAGSWAWPPPYHLARAGLKTLLVDRADRGRATDADAGILSPETNSRDPEAWFDFAAAAVDYYPTLLRWLQAEQDGDTGYAQCGKLPIESAGSTAPSSPRR